MQYTIAAMSVRAWAAEYTGPPFHALLCDPPYELGFMNKPWDKSGVAFDPATWAGLAEHLHPGAFGMAFSSARTYHRMACAIEDAGLVIQPMIAWCYGSGYPKATRIDTAIDRAAGATQAITGEWHTGWHGTLGGVGAYQGLTTPDARRVRAPATPLAEVWHGHRYGGQAIKPAMEPICIFRRPYDGAPVDSIVATGAGAINVDGARIGTNDATARVRAIPSGPSQFGYSAGGMGGNGHEAGRWPANLILSHNGDCNGACTPGCAVAALGEQSGVSVSTQGRHGGHGGAGYGMQPRERDSGLGDSGTAARYFYNAEWTAERLEASAPFYYAAKASTRERENGLGTPPGERRNDHTTVKPIDLARHLAALLLPPAAYAPRRVLIPFCGVGSEMIGAGLAGWDHATGIDSDPRYVAMARRRIAWWVDVFAAEAA